jgi:hypothetical protein
VKLANAKMVVPTHTNEIFKRFEKKQKRVFFLFDDNMHSVPVVFIDANIYPM